MDEYDPSRVSGLFNIRELFRIYYYGWGSNQEGCTREYEGLIREAGPETAEAAYLTGFRDFFSCGILPNEDDNACYYRGFFDAQRFCIDETKSTNVFT